MCTFHDLHIFFGIAFHVVCNTAVCECLWKIEVQINGVIVSQKKESILNCLKRVVSNSSLTSCSNLRRFKKQICIMPACGFQWLLLNWNWYGKTDAIITVRITVLSSAEEDPELKSIYGNGHLVYNTSCKWSTNHNRLGHLTNQSKAGSRKGGVLRDRIL